MNGSSVLDSCVLLSSREERREERLTKRTEVTSSRGKGDGRNGGVVNGSLTRKTTTTSVVSRSLERKETRSMGPDAQALLMDDRYAGGGGGGGGRPSEYVAPNAYPTPRYGADQPYPDAGGVVDPYAYARPGAPLDPPGARRTYDTYEDYGSAAAYGLRPSSGHSDDSAHSPSLLRSTDYLRGGAAYAPAGYDDIDRPPDYLSPSANPPNYGGGGEERGGLYWNDVVGPSTSHYGNLPVQAYLLESPPPPPPPVGRGESQGEEGSSCKSVSVAGVRWRDPDLHEVIQFLGNPNPVVKANAAAYLQHLCYMDDPVKAKTRALGGIPPLVALLSHDQPEVHRNSCGALRNLSYGRQNDENKKAIKSAGGVPALVRLLKRTPDNEVKELVTGVLWNLSSCEELKKSIIDDGILALVNNIIIPHSGWDRGGSAVPDATWSTVFKNSSGVLRNVSSAGEYARKKLRECEGLVEALLHVVRCALSRADIDDKSVENCVCILRNLSYRCQEVEDPNYDKHPPPVAQNRAGAGAAPKGDNLGCFGANKKKKEAGVSSAGSPKEGSGSSGGGGGSVGGRRDGSSGAVRGMELLWQPEVVGAYLALLSNCSNPETLEAAAGAIQNLAACYWQPSIEIRAAVRKEKGLPVLVELLRMEVDRVVCAVATALRNLALDQRNKELIGKYAMRDLVQKLPSGRGESNTSDDTIAAVLATLNEVIKKNAEFSRSLMEAEGVERLVHLTQAKRRFSGRVVKFASQVLYSMWAHQELREVYKKGGWTEGDFVAKGGGRAGSPGPQEGSAGSPINANSTLNRPMASQSGTRYEDKTMTRNTAPKPPPTYAATGGEEVPLADMPYPDGHQPGGGGPGFRMFGGVKEPLYAQVNRDKKKKWTSTSPPDHLNGGDSWV